MNHLVNKEVSGKSHSKSRGQQLNIQIETSGVEWYSSGVVLGSGFFDIFFGDTDNTNECTLRKFVNDTKPCG